MNEDNSTATTCITGRHLTMFSARPEVRKASVPIVSLDIMLWKRPSCPNICKLDSFSLRASGVRASHSPRSRSSCRILILLRYYEKIVDIFFSCIQYCTVL